MNPTVIVDVTEEPITLGECYAQINFDYDSDTPQSFQSLLTGMLKSAREYCENFAGLSFANKTLQYYYESFEDELFVPFGPVIEIESVTYENGEYDSDGFPVRVDANYIFNPHSSKLTSRNGWPKGSNVVIQYRAGYGLDSDAKQLPFVAKQAILLVVGDLMENRQDSLEKQQYSIPNGSQSLLRPLRERLGMA